MSLIENPVVCDRCQSKILASQGITIKLGVPRPSQLITAHLCSQQCAQRLVNDAHKSDAFRHERELIKNEALRINVALDDSPSKSDGKGNEENEEEDDDRFGLRDDTTTFENIASQMGDSLRMEDNDEEHALIEASTGNILTRMFGGERTTMVDTADIEKQIMKRIDAYGEQISARGKETALDAQEVNSAMIAYLQKMSITGDLQKQYLVHFIAEWIDSVKKTISGPGWLVDGKYATKPKDVKEFFAKRTKYNIELGTLFGKFVVNSYSPEPTKGVNWGFMCAGIWSIINNVRKSRGINGMRLLEALFAAVAVSAEKV